MSQRRGKGEGTLYQRPDGTWRAMVDLGWSGGRRVRRSVSGAARREVVEKLKAARRAMDVGLMPTSDRLTVEAYLTDWLDATRESVRPATWARYRGIVRTHHILHLGRIPLSKLTPGDVERMLREMTGSPGPVTMPARSCEPRSSAPWRMG